MNSVGIQTAVPAPSDLNTVFSDFYAAASGRLEWCAPLQRLAEKLNLWAAQLVGVDKRSGRLIFSAEGGAASHQAALDYIRHYHTINPRLEPAIATPLGKWMHCHEHFDEAYVATNTFYQEFLIPHGGRYLTSMKLVDNRDFVFMLGLMRGSGAPPLTQEDDEMLRALQHHGSEALHNFIHLRESFAELGVARLILSQFSYPMLLVDEARGIWHSNQVAQAFLRAGDLVCERAGVLSCWDARGDLQLTEVIHELSLSQATRTPGTRRRVIHLKSACGRAWLAFVSWVGVESAMGSFGPAGRALVTLHDPSTSEAAQDPFIVAECFDLTPAEARVAIQIAAGASSKQIAQRTGTALSTVRTQLRRVLEKTRVKRQADLVRVLMSLPSRAVP